MTPALPLEAVENTAAPVLSVQDLTVKIASDAGVVDAVQALSLCISRGQTFALVGESGCGKSMTALALLRLLPDAGWIAQGSVYLDGTELNQLPEQGMRRIRGGHIGIIFQEPSTSLNPLMTIGQQLAESLRTHTPYRGQALRQRAVWWLERVGIPDPAGRMSDYPFQFSGGQKQRIMIAIALAAEPALLVADEPTTALDVTVQAQILDLLADIQQEMGLAILLITHDLAVVKNVADHVALMRSGEILVTVDAATFFASPDHPYARQLIAAIPTFAKRGLPLSAASQPTTSAAPSVGSKTNATDVESPVLLAVKDLTVAYRQQGGFFSKAAKSVPVLNGVSFALKAGETLALLGESGCGKTTVAKVLLRLLDNQTVIGGSAMLGEQNLLQAKGARLRQLRQQIQIVFQDPYASLDPRMPVGEILDEGLAALRPDRSRADRTSALSSLLDRVGLPANTMQRYPHEFSGGQRQRIAIARALAVEPSVLICDEPTSALDVSVQAQILDLLNDLQAELNIAYLFITHNFGVVEYLSDRIAIMDAGEIVETGATSTILSNPQHELTQRLLEAVPRF